MSLNVFRDLDVMNSQKYDNTTLHITKLKICKMLYVWIKLYLMRKRLLEGLFLKDGPLEVASRGRC